MCKSNPNIRAIKMMRSFCPAYFELLILKSVVGNFLPFFNVYMMAMVVDSIIEGKGIDKLVSLIWFTLSISFIIAILDGFLVYAVGVRTTLLYQREDAYTTRKTLMLDYEHLENPIVRQLRRKIVESSRVNHHGVKLLMDAVGKLIDNAVKFFFAILLGAEMFSRLLSTDNQLRLVAFCVLFFLVICFHIGYSFKAKKVEGTLWHDLSKTMIEENRVDDVIECYNMGKDIRLYRQDKVIMNIKNHMFNIHKKAFKC